MPFQIIRSDITKVTADAIVNTANPKPIIGGGTDNAIYAAAGEDELLALRRKIGDIRPGEAVHTSALRLPAAYIIHTVGPVWVDGNHGEREILRSCYENSLNLADKLGCTSIAFPLISSGVYGFPKDEALSIAYSAIGAFLMKHEMQVILVVLDGQALTLSKTLMGSIDQYIDEHSAQAIRRREYGEDDPSRMRQIVALRGLLAKFEQNPALKQHLLATGDAYLVECAWKDTIWACGRRLNDARRFDAGQWRGQNLLGFALMEVRRQLRGEA